MFGKIFWYNCARGWKLALGQLFINLITVLLSNATRNLKLLERYIVGNNPSVATTLHGTLYLDCFLPVIYKE